MKIPPALVLFFLAPAVAELLLGSSPPAEFFNPIILLLLSSLYGSGALIIHELKVKWNKGFVSMFILGATYGMIEEGLMVKSFFDPEWMDIGILGVYGRWLGVNWVWSEWLTIYHAIFSIAIPITLVELAYPERRNERWINDKKLAGTIVLLSSVTIFGYLFLTSYYPPLLNYLSLAALVFILIFLAWKIPSDTGKKGKLKIVEPRKLTITGFLSASAFFLLFMLGPYIIVQPQIIMLLGLCLVYSTFYIVKRYNWNKNTLYHKFSLVSGAVIFLIILAPLQELDSSRLDNTRGMFIVGIAALILLLLLRKNTLSEYLMRDI